MPAVVAPLQNERSHSTPNNSTVTPELGNAVDQDRAPCNTRHLALIAGLGTTAPGREETNLKLASESPARAVRDEGGPMPTTAPMDELLDERLAHRGRTDQDTAAV